MFNYPVISVQKYLEIKLEFVQSREVVCIGSYEWPNCISLASTNAGKHYNNECQKNVFFIL